MSETWHLKKHDPVDGHPSKTSAWKGMLVNCWLIFCFHSRCWRIRYQSSNTGWWARQGCLWSWLQRWRSSNKGVSKFCVLGTCKCHLDIFWRAKLQGFEETYRLQFSQNHTILNWVLESDLTQTKFITGFRTVTKHNVGQHLYKKENAHILKQSTVNMRPWRAILIRPDWLVFTKASY